MLDQWCPKRWVYLRLIATIFDYLRIEKFDGVESVCKTTTKAGALVQTTTYIDHLEEDRVCDEEQKNILWAQLEARQSLAELSLRDGGIGLGRPETCDTWGWQSTVAGSSDSLDCFLESLSTFDTSLGDQEIQATCLSLLSNTHFFLRQGGRGGCREHDDRGSNKKDLETLISVTKPNYS